jgi:hypothetical protein
MIPHRLPARTVAVLPEACRDQAEGYPSRNDSDRLGTHRHRMIGYLQPLCGHPFLDEVIGRPLDQRPEHPRSLTVSVGQRWFPFDGLDAA